MRKVPCLVLNSIGFDSSWAVLVVRAHLHLTSPPPTPKSGGVSGSTSDQPPLVLVVRLNPHLTNPLSFWWWDWIHIWPAPCRSGGESEPHLTTPPPPPISKKKKKKKNLVVWVDPHLTSPPPTPQIWWWDWIHIWLALPPLPKSGGVSESTSDQPLPALVVWVDPHLTSPLPLWWWERIHIWLALPPPPKSGGVSKYTSDQLPSPRPFSLQLWLDDKGRKNKPTSTDAIKKKTKYKQLRRW